MGIIDAIDHGYIIKKDGTHININDEHGIDHLGDVIESSLYSKNPQYYGALHNHAHILLGRQSDPKGKFNLPPSVMEHFETATRDPSSVSTSTWMVSSRSTRTLCHPTLKKSSDSLESA